MLPPKGKQAYAATMRLQAPWIDDVASGISIKDLRTFQRVIGENRAQSRKNMIVALRQRLEGADELEAGDVAPRPRR